MKTRSNFVSNSSTSSFIIFYKTRVNEDLLDDFIWYLQHVGHQMFDEAFALENQPLDVLHDLTVDWNEGNRLLESYAQQGRKPVHIQFSYHDRIAHRLFKELEEAGKIVVISLS